MTHAEAASKLQEAANRIEEVIDAPPPDLGAWHTQMLEGIARNCAWFRNEIDKGVTQ